MMSVVWITVASVLLVIGLVVLAGWNASKKKLDEFVRAGKELQVKQPGGRRQGEDRVVILAFDVANVGQAKRKEAFLNVVAKVLPEGCRHTWYIVDEHCNVNSWALNISPPCVYPLGGMLTVERTVPVENVLTKLNSCFEEQGFLCSSFHVRQTVYTDYGEYAGPATKGWNPSEGRTWGLGERSPYDVNLTVFPKRPELTQAQFKENWENVQSPMSEIMQPRARYVRNMIESPGNFTSHSTLIDAVVIESWPSKSHHDNPFLFFDARSVWELVVNICVMLRSATGFAKLSQIQGFTVSEYSFEKFAK